MIIANYQIYKFNSRQWQGVLDAYMMKFISVLMQIRDLIRCLPSAISMQLYHHKLTFFADDCILYRPLWLWNTSTMGETMGHAISSFQM